MQEFAFGLSLVLLVPYFVWGIYLLRLRYQFHEELPVKVEVVTLLLLFLYYGVELLILNRWLTSSPVVYLFTVLGFAISGAALYGHMFISLLSRVLVDLVLPNDDLDTVGPRFGPAEALERLGDYEGALQEYLVMARIFPKDAGTCVRVANTYVELKLPGDAAAWYERGLKRVEDDERALTIVNRLCGIYDGELDAPESSIRALEQFLERYGASTHCDRVRLRLVHRRQAPARPASEEDGPPSPNLLRL
jgi:uncharacterized protein YhhL (DUF1145 family)